MLGKKSEPPAGIAVVGSIPAGRLIKEKKKIARFNNRYCCTY